MRRNGAILCLAILSLLLTGIAAQAQEKPPDVDVTIEHQDSGWVVSPLWVAVGAIGLVALVALLVAVARGGSQGPATTIVKER